MPVDPILTPYLPAPVLPDDVDFAALRLQDEAGLADLMALVVEPGPDSVHRQIATIPVDGGTIDLAIYRPPVEDALPVHLYLHGGGWVGGSALSPIIDVIARERAIGADCIVVAVNYRKAPEYPFPTPLTDCQAALHWVVAHAEQYGIDPSVITVGGASAGGNLAAALTLKNRDENGPAIAFQLLEVPALDLTLSLPSHSEPLLGSRYALHRPTVELVVRAYLGDQGNPLDPYASPLLATDHSGLPSTYIMGAEYDLLRDDGLFYAQKLRDAGTPAEFSLQRGHVHHSAAFTKIMPAARAWRSETIAALRAASQPVTHTAV